MRTLLDDLVIAKGLSADLLPTATYYKWAVIQPSKMGVFVYPSDDIVIGVVEKGKLVERYMPERFTKFQDAIEFVDMVEV